MDSDTTARLSAESEKRIESSNAHNGPPEQEEPPFGHDIEQGQEEASDDKTEDTDPNIVDWDGPDDPENPMNWSLGKKNTNVFLVSVFTFLTSLASSIFAPALDLVVRDFGEPQPELTSFILSVYLLGYCFGPLVVAPLSEIYGRVPLYHVCNVLFIAWTIACALAPSLGALIAFRFLAGLAASCPTSIGGGSVADLIPQRRRGAYMSIWTFGPLWGPILGPIAGGYLSEALGWRWCFWLVTIVAGVLTVPMILFLKETYAPALLERKASRLRQETGNEKLRSRMSSGKTQKEVIKLAIVRPTKMLIFSPVTLLMAVYIAVMYGQLYCLFSGMSYVFEVAYGYSAGQIGLTFLGPGIGSMVGVFIAGMATDRVAIHLSKRNGGQMLPKHRLPMCFLGGVFAPIGLFWFGWASHQREHWVVPLIGTSLFGASVVIALMSVSTYLVDAFEQYAASALGANMVLRSLVAALLPLSGRGLYESLGIGWGNSVLAFLGVAIIPVPVLLYMYGERLRQKTFFNVTF